MSRTKMGKGKRNLEISRQLGVIPESVCHLPAASQRCNALVKVFCPLTGIVFGSRRFVICNRMLARRAYAVRNTRWHASEMSLVSRRIPESRADTGFPGWHVKSEIAAIVKKITSSRKTCVLCFLQMQASAVTVCLRDPPRNKVVTQVRYAVAD